MSEAVPLPFFDRIVEMMRGERQRQVAQHGFNHDLEDGFGPEARWLLPYTNSSATEIETEFRWDYEAFQERTGKPTWAHLIREEMAEAFCEADYERRVEELVQVMALCCSHIETLYHRWANEAIVEGIL